MADVDMTDPADTAPSKEKTATKTAKSATVESAGDNKKRFEVKKVCVPSPP